MHIHKSVVENNTLENTQMINYGASVNKLTLEYFKDNDMEIR